ncbi:26s proteasome subunit p55, partial [Cystoisospora suis]
MAEETASSVLKDKDGEGGEVNEGKMTEDFSKQATELIEKLSDLQKKSVISPTNPVYDELFALEKKCRQANDGASGSRLCCFYLQSLNDLRKKYEEKDGVSSSSLVPISISFLCEQIVMLCKKRGQLKRSISEIVKLAVGWLKDMKKEEKLEMIETLKKVTEGKVRKLVAGLMKIEWNCVRSEKRKRGENKKVEVEERGVAEIFVEVERARLVLMLAEMKEAEGKIDEAATILQEVQVETFGAMEKREKTAYILKQMDLVLRRGDFIRCQIISKKINVKLLDNDESLQDFKIRFYELMIVYYLHENFTLDCCKAYFSLFNTPSIQGQKDQWILVRTHYLTSLKETIFPSSSPREISSASSFSSPPTSFSSSPCSSPFCSASPSSSSS